MPRRFLELFFDGEVLSKRDVQFGSQRNASRAKKIKFLINTFNETLRSCFPSEREKPVSPDQRAARGSMSVTIDLCECIYLAGFLADIFDVVDHSEFGRVKEQFHSNL